MVGASTHLEARGLGGFRVRVRVRVRVVAAVKVHTFATYVVAPRGHDNSKEKLRLSEPRSLGGGTFEIEEAESEHWRKRKR